MFSDFHAHMTGYESGKLEQVLDVARSQRVELILAPSTTLETSEETVRLAQRHKAVMACVGIHPWEAVFPTEDVMKKLGKLAARKKVVAIGEVGLDYVRAPDTKDIQLELFRRQVRLARERGLPLNVHCKGAQKDVMDILRQEGARRIRGAAHGFEGDATALADWLGLGFYISIGLRAFTRGAAAGFAEAVRRISADRLLIETDSSPKSVDSGEMSGPASVVSVAEKVAALLGTTQAEIGGRATTNLKRLLADHV